MPYHVLLTHVIADPGCQSRLRMTASVARALGAEVVGLGAQAPWPCPTEGGVGTYYEQIAEATRGDLAAAAALFRDAFKDSPTASPWREEMGYPDEVIPRHARVADLVVAYPTDGEISGSVYARPDTLVMETGLPVLLLPRREKEFRAERVLFAWKNTRETRRAISATLPLLKQAGRVLVAAVCRDHELPEVEAQLSDVAQRLSRHGITAATLAEVDAPGAAGHRLLRIAETDTADVVIAGAYGHSRLREWALGGVTRDLIADGGRYVLLNH